MKGRLLVLIGIFAANFIGSRFVFADGGDATLIHACVAKNGTLRLVSSTTVCGHNETASHWPTSARILTDEGRITNTENKNTSQDSLISALQTKNTQQDGAISALQNSDRTACIIKDSLGKVVGDKSDCHAALKEINGIWIYINVAPNGFVVGGDLFFTDESCSGQSYLQATNSLVQLNVAFDGRYLLYPNLHAAETITGRIMYNFHFSSSLCIGLHTEQLVFWPTAKYDTAPLGLVPPFHLE